MQPIEFKKMVAALTIIKTSDYQSERTIRQLLSQLRKEGVIFIPSKLGKGIYVRIDTAHRDEIEQYAQAQAKHFKTQYFNTMLPMKKYLEDQKLKDLFGQFEGMLEIKPKDG
jgi:transposase